jgi:UDP-N-acetylglucosamine 3-dehydrogenase
VQLRRSSELLKVGVIGLGSMGRQHARVYDEMDNLVELVAVADSNPEALQRATRRRLTRGYLDYREMLECEDLDAVSVVVPTSVHHVVCAEVIDHGIDLLVEKPIAANSDLALKMIQHAERAGVRLAVGHVERSNPAVVELRRQLAQGKLGRVFQVKARRAGPFPERIKDVGVVIDLATHDLDLMLHLTRSTIERVHAETTRNIHTEHEDGLMAVLRFADGSVGSLDVNWLTPYKVRDLTLVGARGMFVVDYLRQELLFCENGSVVNDWDHLAVLSGVSEGRTIRLVVPRIEPLRAELEAFLEAVRSRTTPAVDGWDGLQALVAAEAILASARNCVALSESSTELALAGALRSSA